MPHARHVDTASKSEAPQSRVGPISSPTPTAPADATPTSGEVAVPKAADGDHDDKPPEREEIPDLPPTSLRTPVTKPFLASEALIEDLAPLEPSGSSARLWCAALGVGFLSFGAMRLAGVGAGGAFGAAPEIVVGLISLVAALVRVTYRQRAVTMVILGLLSAIVGLRGFPGSQGWGALRVLTALVLPAALLFRARYRAYAPARWILGAAFALSLPFAIVSIVRVAHLNPSLMLLGDAVALVAVLASLLGFMGSETTGGGAATALGIVVGLALDLALKDIGAPGARLSVTTVASVVTSAAVFAGTSAMASLGLFQVLAWRFAADARRINLHPAPKEAKRKPMPSSDWSTKD